MIDNPNKAPGGGRPLDLNARGNKRAEEAAEIQIGYEVDPGVDPRRSSDNSILGLHLEIKKIFK